MLAAAAAYPEDVFLLRSEALAWAGHFGAVNINNYGVMVRVLAQKILKTSATTISRVDHIWGCQMLIRGWLGKRQRGLPADGARPDRQLITHFPRFSNCGGSCPP